MLELENLLLLMRSTGTSSLNLVMQAAGRDPLISKRLEVWQYVGITAVAVALVFVVRVLSPKAEHALLFAAFLSIILIVFFLSG